MELLERRATPETGDRTTPEMGDRTTLETGDLPIIHETMDTEGWGLMSRGAVETLERIFRTSLADRMDRVLRATMEHRHQASCRCEAKE